MPIKIQLKIKHTDIKKSIHDSLFALAKAGLHGMYHDEPLTADAAIYLVNDHTLSSHDEIKALLDANKDIVEVTHIESCDEPVSAVVSFNSILKEHINSYKTDDDVLNAIIQSIISSIPTILNEEFLHPSNLPTTESTSVDTIHNIIKLERNLYGCLALIHHRQLQPESSALKTSSTWDTYFKPWNTFKAPTNKIQSFDGQEDQIAIDITIFRQPSINMDASALRRQYETDLTLFTSEIIKVTGIHTNQLHIKYSENSITAGIIIDGLTVPPKQMPIFVFNVQRSLIATGLLNEFHIHISHMWQPDSIKRVKTDLLKELKMDDITSSGLNKGLRTAAANNLPEMVDALMLFDECDINAQDANVNSQRTALHLAIERKHIEMVRLLLSHGAKTDIHAADGKTPRDLSLTLNDQEIRDAVMATSCGSQKTHDHSDPSILEFINAIATLTDLQSKETKTPQHLLLQKYKKPDEKIVPSLNKALRRAAATGSPADIKDL
ncbi:MAG: ankyrin repeat domain-containing protein, partial [Gammaproteobacteria bacterium]